MSARAKPGCAATLAWLTAHNGKAYLAPLTGQDSRALHAFAHLLELYAAADGSGQRHAVRAMREAVLAMQRGCRRFAKAAILSVLDSEGAKELWLEIVESDPSGELQVDVPSDDEQRRIRALQMELHTEQGLGDPAFNWCPPRFLPPPDPAQWTAERRGQADAVACASCGRFGGPRNLRGVPKGMAEAGSIGRTTIFVCADACPVVSTQEASS